MFKKLFEKKVYIPLVFLSLPFIAGCLGGGGGGSKASGSNGFVEVAQNQNPSLFAIEENSPDAPIIGLNNVQEPQPLVTPEPATLLLLGSGMAVVGLSRRKK